MKKRILAVAMIIVMVFSLLPTSAMAATIHTILPPYNPDPSAPPGGDPTGGHTHNWVWNTTKEPTCTEPGEMEGKCYGCGQTQHSTIPALGHDWGEWEVTVPSLCLEDGVREHVCQRCGITETEPVPAHGHDFCDWHYVSYPNSAGQVIMERSCYFCDLTEQKTETITVVLEIVEGEDTTGKKAGDYVQITYRVTNTGEENVTVNGYYYLKEDGSWAANDYISGWDTKLDFLGGGESVIFMISSKITQEDIDKGYIAREVHVSGNVLVKDGSSYVTNGTGFDSNTVYPTANLGGEVPFGIEDPDEPMLLVHKSVVNSPAGEHFRPGETIIFEVTVTNPTDYYTGETHVYDLMTGDMDIVGMDGHNSQSVYFSYTVTAEDAIKGYIENQAKTINYWGTCYSNVVHLEIDPFAKVGSLDVTKKVVNSPADGQYFTAGETIEFELTATNNTNMVLNTVSLYDIYAPLSVKDVKILNPGSSFSVIVPYIVLPGDVSDGFITNVAFAEGWDEDGDFYNGSTQLTVDLGKAAPSGGLDITKTVTNLPASGFFKEGDVVEYTITVSNNTGEDLYNVCVTDPLKNPAPVIDWFPVLGAGETKNAYFGYTVKDTDVDTGSITNTAGATGSKADGSPVSGSSNTIVVPTGKETGNILFSKHNTNWGTVSDRGYYTENDPVGYEIDFYNNTGDTIYDVRIYDPAIQSAPIYQAASVADKDGQACFGAHFTTYADCVNKSVTNTAWINYVDSDGFSHTIYSNSITVPCDFTPKDPAVSITKVETSSPKGNYYVENDVISYTITVTNTGGTDLYNVIVSDCNQGYYGGQLGVLSVLPAGASHDFPFSHVVDSYDCTVAGYVENLAAVVVTTPDSYKILDISNPVYSPCSEDPVITTTGLIPAILEGEDCCSRTLNADPDGDIGYTVMNCTDHATIDGQVLDMVNAAADAEGRAAAYEKAQELWRAEIDSLYDVLLENVQDPYYSIVIMNERNMFYAQLESFEASLTEIYAGAPDRVGEIVTGELKAQCEDLCWLLHHAGEEPSVNASDDLNTTNAIMGTACSAESLKRDAGHSEYVLDMCGMHKAAGQATAVMMGAENTAVAVNGSLDWTRVYNMWTTEFNAVMDARYSAASGTLKNSVKAEHIDFMTWADCHRSFMDLFYDNEETRNMFMARTLMNRAVLACEVSEGATANPSASAPIWTNPGLNTGKDAPRDEVKTGVPGWAFAIVGVAAAGGAGAIVLGKKKSGKGKKKSEEKSDE